MSLRKIAPSILAARSVRMMPKNVEEEKLHRRLKHHVLLYLKDNGPTDISILYVNFDPNMSAYLAPVLQDLRQWNYIKLDEKELVEITDAGIRILQDVNYWK